MLGSENQPPLHRNDSPTPLSDTSLNSDDFRATRHEHLDEKREDSVRNDDTDSFSDVRTRTDDKGAVYDVTGRNFDEGTVNGVTTIDDDEVYYVTKGQDADGALYDVTSGKDDKVAFHDAAGEKGVEGTFDDVSKDTDDVSVGTVAPPDGGWGWMVTLAGFIMAFLFQGIMGSFGLLMPALMSTFDASVSLTSLAPSVFIAANLLSGEEVTLNYV